MSRLHRDPFPAQGHLRHRYTDQVVEDERKLARILLESGEPAPEIHTRSRATAPGDIAKLRGIPMIGRGVGGAIAGTRR